MTLPQNVQNRIDQATITILHDALINGEISHNQAMQIINPPPKPPPIQEGFTKSNTRKINTGVPRMDNPPPPPKPPSP